MATTEEHVTNAVGDSARDVDQPTTAAEDARSRAVESATDTVGAFVGVLTRGFVIAAAAGFVVGVALGTAIVRRATPPPPRWQVWR